LKHTHGNWDCREENIYFIAASTENLKTTCHDHVLIAVNEIMSADGLALIKRFIEQGRSVLLDSGIFNLTNAHMRRHGISMDEALALPPDEIDGFGILYDRYCQVVDEIGHMVWGYIELDQGGRENKIITRQGLEKKGYRPMPVYHPLNDGWDYFDYLAERYDRICFGNVVQADLRTRERLLHTAWKRKEKYPNLWIHLLGMTANQRLISFPINSCDSSTWISSLRWGTLAASTANAPFSKMDRRYIYRRDVPTDHARGWDKANELCGYDAHFRQEVWRAALRDGEAL
jgi:hypothetical protein